jgi:hypothetical protein
MSNTDQAKFSLGTVTATPGALRAIRQSGQTPREFLDRHARGDWGDLSDEDRRLNDAAITDGSRLLSAYTLRSRTRVWIITEAAGDDGHRAATTLLLPTEY